MELDRLVRFLLAKPTNPELMIAVREAVAAWLNEQGYSARNLAGGITQWAAQGGEVQTGKAAGGGSGAWQ